MLTEDEIKAICDARVKDSLDENTELAEQRATALDYYLGEPFGNEIDDRSQVISTDVADTVETLLPGLLKMFTSSESAVQFDPESEDDEEQAEQETDYVNHVVFKENRGFLFLYTGFKDGLLSKNGIGKVFWDESKEKKRETYEGLSDLQLNALDNETGVEIIEHEERVTTIDVEMVQNGAAPLLVPGTDQPMIVHDVVIERTETVGKVCLEPVPPEEFLISRRARSIYPSDADFCAHRTLKTISDLVSEGFDKEKIEFAASHYEERRTQETEARNYLEDDNSTNAGNVDKSMREIYVTECYIHIDVDEDGVAELYKVTLAGNQILEYEEIDRIPFVSFTPVILTHKFYGLSIADLVMDLQLIKSTILRQILDNMYLLNNKGYAVGGDVNMDDLLTSRPGRNVRVENGSLPHEQLMELPVSQLGSDPYNLLGYLDEVKDKRTGANQNMAGMNEKIANMGVHSVERLMTAAEQRIELIARIFAEGVKDTFMQVRELLSKYQDKEKQVKLKGKWQVLSPSEWKDRTHVSINVGLGQGDRGRQVMILQQFLADQKEFIQLGMQTFVTPKKIFNLEEQIARLSGITPGADSYFVDPESDEGQQLAQQAAEAAANQPDPTQQILEFQAQMEQQKQQFEAQIDLLKQRQENDRKDKDLEFKYAELEARMLEKLTEFELKYKQNVPGSAV